MINKFTKQINDKKQNNEEKNLLMNIFGGFSLSESITYIVLWLSLIIYFFFCIGSAKAQTAVAVGSGSYASFPPDAAAKTFSLATGINVADTNTRPIPTNDWWTHALFNKFGGNMWAHPVTLTTATYGMQVFFPQTWAAGDMVLGWPLKLRATSFAPAKNIVKDWTDWTVLFNLTDGAKSMDITVGHGLPVVWTETKGITPQVDFGKGVFSFFNDEGTAITMPQTTDHIGVTHEGKYYGVFFPNNTALTLKDSLLTVTYSGSANGFVIIALLNTKSDLAEFAKYTYAVPRKTTVNWNYRPNDGKIDITWNITSQALKGTNQQVIQGFIPHHYKRTTTSVAFNGMEYATPRGKMKCSVGNSFSFTYDFNGVLPHLPAPKTQAVSNPYQPARMDQLTEIFAAKTGSGNDTYWGGKDLISYAKYALIAKETGNSNYESLKAKSRSALVDWYTYTPGEGNHYFAKYDKWGALVGFAPSYGSEQFTDNHFHLGYHTYATAMQGMMDADFIDKYGEMAKLVAKQYANWDRNDKRFPMFRTFDPWAGHSFAGGSSSGNGNNQESTSESMQGWAGIYLLGSVTNDKAMMDAGAFGYLSEARATMEYWFNWDKDNFPASYTKTMAGIVFSGAVSYGTWFSGAPRHIHGIQYLPWGPIHNYLAMDTAWARSEFNQMMKEENNPAEVTTFGADWGNVMLTFQQMYDAPFVAKKLDQYWTANEPLIFNMNDNGGLTYYYTHSNRTLGTIQWNYHISIPTSSTNYNKVTGKYNHVVFNPSKTEQIADVYKDGVLGGSYKVPALTTVTFTLPNPITSLGISKPAKTVAIGQTLQLTAKGLDSFGGIYPLTGGTWTVSGGGTIDAKGLFTATTNAYPVIVKIQNNGLTATDTIRVGTAPVLTELSINPSFVTLAPGATQQYTVVAKDQYGEKYDPIGAVWSAGNNGTVSSTGLFTAGNTGGANEVKLTRGNISASALVNVKTPPTTNLALLKPATASTSNGNNNATAAVDGSPTTRWESSFADNQWLTVDLQKSYNLTSVVIIWEPAYGKNYDIQVSEDGTNWTTIKSETAGNGGTDSHSLSGTGRYVRIKCNTRATNYGFSIFELQVYGDPATGIVATNIVVVPSSTSIFSGKTKQFTAYGFDSNGNRATLTGTWSVSGGGTVNNSGLVTASTVGGPYTLTYKANINGTATYNVTAATADCNGVSGGSAIIDACGKCAGGNTGITPQTDPAGCVTTIKENVNNSFEIFNYPNPSNDVFNINVNGLSQFELIVTDVNGKLVHKGIYKGNDQIKIGEDYKAGVYFGNIMNSNVSKAFKLVKY